LAHVTLAAREYTRDLNEAVLKSIEANVTAVLGEQVLESLFLYLEKYQALPRDEIPSRLELFFSALEKAFGPRSGRTLGRFIINDGQDCVQAWDSFANRTNPGLLECVEKKED